MICLSTNLDVSVVFQKADRKFIFLHWTPKSYALDTLASSLNDLGFKPIGPTMLVEWEE